MTDTQWPAWEVFHQPGTGEAFVHVGAVHAPDAELALQMARDQFTRRQPCTGLWVVRAEHIVASTQAQSEPFFARLMDKSFREPQGFLSPLKRTEKAKRDE